MQFLRALKRIIRSDDVAVIIDNAWNARRKRVSCLHAESIESFHNLCHLMQKMHPRSRIELAAWRLDLDEILAPFPDILSETKHIRQI